MKRIMSFFLLGLIVITSIIYAIGLYDDMYKNSFYTGIWYKDIVSSFRYFILWVLPYWWLVIIIGSVVFSLIFYTVSHIFDKLKG